MAERFDTVVDHASWSTRTGRSILERMKVELKQVVRGNLSTARGSSSWKDVTSNLPDKLWLKTNGSQVWTKI